jgi:hypothetical protein
MTGNVYPATLRQIQQEQIPRHQRTAQSTHTVYLRVSYYLIEQRSLPYGALTEWSFVTEKECCLKSMADPLNITLMNFRIPKFDN